MRVRVSRETSPIDCRSSDKYADWRFEGDFEHFLRGREPKSYSAKGVDQPRHGAAGLDAEGHSPHDDVV